MTAKTVCYKKVLGTGTHKWDDNCDCCFLAGHFCQKTVIDDSPSEVTVVPTSGGILITTDFAGMDFNVTNDPVHGTFTSSNDGKNYTFGEDENLFIVSSDEYPGLDNTSWSLEGITTDSNGNFTIFIPIN